MSKIAILIPKFSLYGGSEQFACRLAEALAAHHEVDVICARSEHRPPDGVRVLEVGRYGLCRLLKSAWFLIRAEQMRRRGQYDLTVSLSSTWNQDLLRVGGGPQSIFWKLSERQYPDRFRRILKRLRRVCNPASWLTRYMDNRQYRSGCRIVCVSEKVREWVLEAYPDIPVPDVIGNMPRTDRFHQPSEEERRAARKRFGFRDGEIIIGTAASNFLLKGIPALMRAVALLPDSVILAVAGGRRSGSFMRLAKQLGIADRVRFLGRIDDMPSFYHALDLFVLATWYDACSNAVIEAAACGVRTLTTEYNGSCVFVPEDCRIPDPDDAEDFARRMNAALGRDVPEFAVPKGMQVGLSAWVDLIDDMLRKKQNAAKDLPVNKRNVS